MQVDHSKYKSLTIKGKHYNAKALTQYCDEQLHCPGIAPWEQTLYRFILEWLNDSPVVMVQTSGSTGTPKSMKIAKSAMLHSAFNTLQFFNLQPEQSALLCLPCQYIAGKMMVVRAFAGGLNLIPAPVSGTPLTDLEQPVDFAALTPMQMSNQLQKDATKTSLLRTVILGGSTTNEELENMLRDQNFDAWETYGMTETLSHIALRSINGSDRKEYFTPLPGIKINIDKRNCLVIDAPGITDTPLISNDIAEIREDGKFRILGRIDNIINSGGIKIIPEKIEKKLTEIVSSPFFVTALPHPRLGQQLVLVLQELHGDENALMEKIRNILPRHQVPKKIILRNPLPRTENGKIKRILD